MRAFAAAVELGYLYVETDVRATANGTAVAFHDARLERLTGRPGRIRDVNWNEVRQARVHGVEPIPTSKTCSAPGPTCAGTSTSRIRRL